MMRQMAAGLGSQRCPNRVVAVAVVARSHFDHRPSSGGEKMDFAEEGEDDKIYNKRKKKYDRLRKNK